MIRYRCIDMGEVRPFDRNAKGRGKQEETRMSAKDIRDKRTAFSLEVFPPKTEAGMEALCGKGGVLDQLYSLKPDGIACTYGAGGANLGKNLEILDKLVRDGNVTAMTHFTCEGSSGDGIRAQLQTYLDHGVRQVLICQNGGNLSRNTDPRLQYVSQQVRFLRKEFGSSFTITVADMPEGHMALRSMEDDIVFLKQVQDCGADAVMTRLCWDMDYYCRWMDAVRGADIEMRVTAGVMPVLDQAAVISMTMAGNSSIPRELSELISENWIYPNPFGKDPFDAEAESKMAAFRAAGMAYTVRQIARYRDCGVSGIHLYTNNRFEDAACIAAKADLI